ncbi:MAG: 5'-methylthioadenosine phosphorylase, partial [Mesorhizobium sp.]
MLTNQIASDPADHAADIPQVGLAIITGSANWGLAFPEDIEFDGVRTLRRDVSFETPYGRSDNWKLIEFDASITAEGRTKRALCMYSHGNPRDHIDHSCHRRAFWVLMNAGVKQVL